MNAHALKVLEFDRLLDVLASHASSEPGRLAVKALRPQASPEDAAARRRFYAEALALRHAGATFPPAHFEDPSDALLRAAPERSALDPEAFLLVQRLLEAAAAVRRFLLGDRCDASGCLQALARELDPADNLRDRIARTFDDDQGHVADAASDALRRLRGRISACERHIETRLERMLREAGLATVFQDDFVTQRHGRYVLPVRREMRGALQGIVHDQSNTGGTLFVEPEEVVETGNELECLRGDEHGELRRILLDLTAELRASIPAIRRNAALLCDYDAACAVSAWARETDCRCPESGPELVLVAARHPLLEHRLRAEGRAAAGVPLDFHCPKGRNVIVVTGSNTGGKTVALLTIGLLTVMAQTGLPIPAGPGTSVPFFDDVLADIGDEQSLQQSLSTFSGHLRNIIGMLNRPARAATLVLLDELGAGTDPVEGGALSCAILDVLSRQPGLTVATTHLGAVKRFVHDHPAMENASMLFDVETLQPRYRLLMGQAGASYTLTIAERCGLPSEVVENARSMLGAGDVKLERMLTALDRNHMRLERELAEARQARDETLAARALAERDRETATQALRDLHKERRKVLHAAHGEAVAVVSGARQAVDRILADARQASAPAAAHAVRQRLADNAGRLSADRQATREPAEAPLAPGAARPGDRVWIELLGDHGVVEAVTADGKRATVRAGNLRMDVRVSDLGAARAAAARPTTTPAAAVRRPSGAPDAARELNLLGYRAEAAVAMVARFLDAAILAGLEEVRIVHGYGTGALRQAVHAHLADARIRGFRLGRTGDDPGGPGVTIVTL